MCVFNRGTHVTNHCVRASLGVRINGPTVAIALLVEKRNIVHITLVNRAVHLLAAALYLSQAGMDTVFDNRTVCIFLNTGRSKTVSVFFRYFPVFQKIEYRTLLRYFSVFHNIEYRYNRYRNCLGVVSVFLTIASAVLHFFSGYAFVGHFRPRY